MTSNENCLRNLIGYLGTLIGECNEAMASTFHEMEKFNISSEDFRKESLKLNTAAFTLGYLERIRNMAEETDYKPPRSSLKRLRSWQVTRIRSMILETSQSKSVTPRTVSVSTSPASRRMR